MRCHCGCGRRGGVHEVPGRDNRGVSRSARVHEVPFEFGLNPRDLG
ncbi:glycine cleavage system protein H [Mobiluncus mulieris]|uniref:Glycine cleavage system protein H n=1 Tax=Mobiluncus mulieris TaxID=2052 RepID=A0ABD4TTZ4_9ACTO|nr:glycine cleavage system protein H [Mobiluncus mulieris]MCU9972608.1 glycine cleavage system protein H [Mobiluncus mulieris]MCV0010161.1 glycine cleavage system protein H [Mobiluncus mulieris]